MRVSLVRVSAALVLGLAAACQESPIGLSQAGPALAANATATMNGTIHYVAIEGGCWGLATSQGSYEPVGLPAQFRIDGLPVRVVMRGAPSAVSVCMMAPLVTLDSISAR